MQGGREPEESVYEGGSSTEIQQQQQDPKVSSSTPQQKTEEMSCLDRKLRDLEYSNQIPNDRPGPQDQLPMTNQVLQQQQQHPAGYHQQYRPPPHMPQDLRSVSQDPNVPGYNRTQAGSPQQSFPTGTSSTVPSSFMNRPTPPSTATPPSTNPPMYDSYYDDRYHPQGQMNCRQNDYRHYPTESPSQYSGGGSRPDQHYHPPQYPQEMRGHPPRQAVPSAYHEQGYRTHYSQRQYIPYQPQQYDRYSPNQSNYYPDPRQYAPGPGYRNDQWQYDRPPSYSGFDPMESINPDKFTAAPPTPTPPSQSTTRMEDQLRRLDVTQMPPDYTHRGPDFPSVDSSRHSPSPVRTPEPAAHHSEDLTRNTSSTLQHQQSYVQFPDSMHQSVDSASRVPMQQTDAIPNPAPTPAKENLLSVAEGNQNANHKVSPRQSPVPSQDTDIISPLKQMHLDGATSESTDTQQIEQPSSTVSSMNSWEGERRKPVPTQHTDKLPTRELHHDDSPAVAGEQDYHSAPPMLTGRSLTDEELSSLRSGTREPTQKTEPIG